MQLCVKRIDIKYISVLSVFIGTFCWIISGIGLSLMLAIVTFIILSTQMEIYRRLEQRQDSLENNISEKQDLLYKETEALISLYATQKFNQPLPPMRGSAIAPDFANILLAIINKEKPEVILEFGSGVSTVIIANCLRQLGRGHIYSVDHDEKFANITINNLQQHGLNKQATVIHASLKTTSVNGSDYSWYDTDFLSSLSDFKVDMLIIDGPPRDYKKTMMRYPALPILKEIISDSVTIVLDDADRIDEKKVIDAWLEEFDGFESIHYPTEKGTVVLHKDR